MSSSRLLACCLLLGCGGSSSSTETPGGSTDALDASGDPDPATRVDVTVAEIFVDETPSGGPDITAIAVFRDDQGTVVQHGPVDAVGNAHAFLPSGGSVTVLQIGPDNLPRFSAITHFRAVKPLDHLRVGPPRSPQHFVDELPIMNATYPPFSTPDPGIGVLTGCGGGGQDLPANGTYHMRFFESCMTPTFALLAMGPDSNHFIWQPENAYEAGGTLVIQDAWQPMGQAELSMINAGDTFSVFTELHLVVDGFPTRLDFEGLELSTGATHTLRYAPNAGTGTKLITLVDRPGEGGEMFTSWITAMPASSTLDLDNLPLPKLPSRAQQSTTGVSWAQTFAGNPDVRYVSWFGSWVADGIEHRASVAIVEPPDGPPSTTLPELPAEYAQDDPTKASSITFDPFLRGGVTYLDYDVIDGYDQARQHSASELGNPSASLFGIEHRGHIASAP